MNAINPRSVPHSSYDRDLFALLFAVEDRHFWFQARNKIIATLVKQITADIVPGYRVLEVGCGTGNVLRVLERTCHSGTIIGMDLFSEGLKYARKRTTCSLIQGDICAAPFKKRFNIIGLFDVLEHLPDDLQVLRDLNTMLTCDGVLLVTVPAHNELWSYFDETSHHYRRYEIAELECKLIGTGYKVEYLTQYMVGIFPLVWIGRRLKALTRKHRPSDVARPYDIVLAELEIMPWLNNLLSFLLWWEALLIARRRRLPLGTLLLAIARKVRAKGS